MGAFQSEIRYSYEVHAFVVSSFICQKIVSVNVYLIIIIIFL